MLQATIKKGKVLPEQVPAPNVSEGAVLIKVVNSCISAGTELSAVSSSSQSLIRKALEQPEKVKKMLNMARSEGISSVIAKIKGKLEESKPIGYSLSGIVIGTGKGVTRFRIGDKVAAAGAGRANHAEFVDVPENLVVKMPEKIDYSAASSVAIGAIAMQGVRRANLQIGEFCVVLGTGILGLLTVQMLKASGIRVIAIDLDEHRLELSAKLGAELTVNAGNENPVEIVNNYTGGYGADCVIFTAATHSSEPLSQAFRMCRRKGKVVLVGVAGMQINREDMYAKELDFQISTSYGPGRYDNNYEEKGLDYPYAYVRWTEGRNMSEYLRLIANKQISLDKIIEKVFPISEVQSAFEALNNSANRPLMIVLDYGNIDNKNIQAISKLSLNLERKIILNNVILDKNIVNVALIGAGAFATGMHLPNLQKLANKYKLRAVVDIDGLRAKSIAQQYNADYASTDYEEVLKDADIDLVLITTRHNLHAPFVLKALEAGKHAFVEKPLATNFDDLKKIENFYSDGISQKPVVTVGFNRRFSKYAQEIKKHTSKRINPLLIRYQMNAGYLPLEHWVFDEHGRIIGELCHIIDLATFFTESEIESISVESLSPKTEKYSPSDNKSVILKYKDGSLAHMDYFAIGSSEYPKEHLEVHFDGKTIVMNDYKSLKGYGIKIEEIKTSASEKGHKEELERLYETLKGNTQNWPIELWDMIQTTQATFYIADETE